MPSCARFVATETIGRPAWLAAYFGDVERGAAPDPDDGVVGARMERLDELDGGRDCATRHGMDLAIGELGAKLAGHLLAQTGPDDHRHVPSGRDAPVAQKAREGPDRTASHLDRERASDHTR